MQEATYEFNSSMIQGRHEVVIIHLSSDLEEDIDIDWLHLFNIL